MVRAHGRGIDIANTALQYLYAIRALAANNRRTNTRAEARRVNAYLLRKRRSQSRAYLLAELLSSQQIYWEHRVRTAAMQRSCHDYLFYIFFAVL